MTPRDLAAWTQAILTSPTAIAAVEAGAIITVIVGVRDGAGTALDVRPSGRTPEEIGVSLTRLGQHVLKVAPPCDCPSCVARREAMS